MKKLIDAIKKLWGKLFGPKPLTEFPPGLESLCRDELDNAYAYIESRLGRVLKRKRCVVVTRPGTEQIDGLWAYEAGTSPTGYSGGECNGTRVTLACNPYNPRDVSRGVLRHEIGHHILITQFKNFEHDAAYDEYFKWGHLRK